jgi:hypothetical protein
MHGSASEASAGAAAPHVQQQQWQQQAPVAVLLGESAVI